MIYELSLSTDMQLESLWMAFDESFGIVNNEGEIAATTGAGHLPGEDVGDIAVASDCFSNIAVSIWLLAVGREICGGYHAREHGYLGFEGGTVGCGKGGEVFLQDGIPTGFGGIGEGFHLVGGDVFAFDHRASGLAGLHGYHHEVLLQEAEGHLVGGSLYLLGPEIVVIVMSAQAGNADTDGVLGSRDMSVLTLGVVLEAEDEASEHLGIHLGELDGPNLLNHLTGRGTQSTTVAHLEGGLQ